MMQGWNLWCWCYTHMLFTPPRIPLVHMCLLVQARIDREKIRHTNSKPAPYLIWTDLAGDWVIFPPVLILFYRRTLARHLWEGGGHCFFLRTGAQERKRGEKILTHAPLFPSRPVSLPSLLLLLTTSFCHSIFCRFYNFTTKTQKKKQLCGRQPFSPPAPQKWVQKQRLPRC